MKTILRKCCSWNYYQECQCIEESDFLVDNSKTVGVFSDKEHNKYTEQFLMVYYISSTREM